VSRTVLAIRDEIVLFCESSLTSPNNLLFALLTPDGLMTNPAQLSNIAPPAEIKDFQYKCLELIAPGGKKGSKNASHYFFLC